MDDHNDRGETDHAALHTAAANPELLPEWGEPEAEVDDATWIAALEASRRRQFAELANLD